MPPKPVENRKFSTQFAGRLADLETCQQAYNGVNADAFLIAVARCQGIRLPSQTGDCDSVKYWVGSAQTEVLAVALSHELGYGVCRRAIRSSTTEGSASVEVSPRLLRSFSAILRKILRIILPDRVLGNPGAH